MKLILPAVFSVDEIRADNRIRHIAEPATAVEGTVARFARDRIEGFLFTAAADGVATLVIPKSKNLPASISRSVVGDMDPDAPSVDLSDGKWLSTRFLQRQRVDPSIMPKTSTTSEPRGRPCSHTCKKTLRGTSRVCGFPRLAPSMRSMPTGRYRVIRRQLLCPPAPEKPRSCSRCWCPPNAQRYWCSVPDIARPIIGDYGTRVGMARNAVRLELSASEVAQLNGWQSAHGTAQQVALRCRLVLAAADGKRDLEIATAFRVSRHTASLWRRRVHEKGIGAVWEIEKGRGRKPQLDQARQDAIIAATLETKPAGATHWSCRDMASAQGVSKK